MKFYIEIQGDHSVGISDDWATVEWAGADGLVVEELEEVRTILRECFADLTGNSCAVYSEQEMEELRLAAGGTKESEFREDGWVTNATLHQAERYLFQGFRLGPPRATLKHAFEDLKARGLVGVYHNPEIPEEYHPE